MGATKMQSGALATVRTKELSAIMNELHQPVKQCASVGHIYSNVTTIRCAHDESVSVRVAVWHDNAVGDTTMLWEVVEEFGPFDSWWEIQDRVYVLALVALRVQETCSPL